MLIFAFLLGTIALFFQSVLSPPFILLTYAPWIALCTLSYPIPKSLYLACLAGCVMDLLSENPMGIHALNYTLIAFFLSRWRSYFSSQNPFHLSFFTLLASFFSTLLQLFLLFLFDTRIPFTGQWILGDLLIMPALDALYALIWFSLPLKAYNLGRLHCLNIKKKLFPTSP